MTTKLPRHPSEIPGLVPDCHRLLSDEYQMIQIAADRHRSVDATKQPYVETRLYEANGWWRRQRERTDSEVQRDVAAAIAEYRRVAAMWGVHV